MKNLGGLCLAVALVVVACSSSDGSTSSGGQTAVTTVHVSAAAGGTVADATGKASLVIPPGALAADADITVQLSAAANGSAGDVVDFGPSGLQFTKPAALTLKGDGITVPDGKSAAIGLFDGAAFQPIAGSTFANGVATANIAHFSKYAIVLVDGLAKLVPPANCTETSATFTPCGGDVKGNFVFSDFCIDPKTLGDDPFKGACSDFVGSVDLKSDRTVTVDATTLKVSAGNETTTFAYSFSLSCATGKDSCASLTDTKTTCTDAGSGKCSCTETETKAQEATNQTYTTSGTTLTTTDTDGSSDSSQYCRKSNLLYVQGQKNGAPSGVIYVLAQQ